MSAKVTRGANRKTPRNLNDIGITSDVLETISYDYDEALSQPDLTGFFRRDDYKKISNDDDEVAFTDRSISAKKYLPEKIPAKTKIAKIHDDSSRIGKTIGEKVESHRSLLPKSEPIEEKTNGKIVATPKCPKSSRIPRAKFTALSRLPMRCRGKKLSATRITAAKSKCRIVSETPQVRKAVETTQLPDQDIDDTRKSNHRISIVASVTSNVLSEEKLSGIEADVELEADQEFTTSPDDSPGRNVNNGDPSVADVLRVSKLSHACRSSNDDDAEIIGHRVNTDIWTDSRSSPEVGRYSASGRNGRPITRRLAEMAKNRGYPNDSSDESDTEPTTDFSIYETTRQKKMRKSQNLREIPSPTAPFAKPSVVTSPASRMRTRPRLRFSFFNTLFDIVFWPFLFLRPNR